jgi:hypothetical protein
MNPQVTYGEDLMTTLFNVSLGEKGAVNVLAIPASKAKGVEPAPEFTMDDDLLGYVMNVCTPDEIEKLIAGKVAQATTGEDATIVRKDGDGPAPGPTNGNGTAMF